MMSGVRVMLLVPACPRFINGVTPCIAPAPVVGQLSPSEGRAQKKGAGWLCPAVCKHCPRLLRTLCSAPLTLWLSLQPAVEALEPNVS